MQIEQFIHRYRLHTGYAEDAIYRAQAQDWYTAACLMIQQPAATQHFISVLRKVQKKKIRERDIVITVDNSAHTLLQGLQDHGLVHIILETEHETTCFIPGGDQRAFLSGDWLKIYLWQQLLRMGCYDDVRWGVRLVLHAQMEYELDVLCLHEETLTLFECNTMADPIAKSTLYLNLITTYRKLFLPAPLNAYFVAIHPHLTQLPHYEDFALHAQQQSVHLLSGYALSQPFTLAYGSENHAASQDKESSQHQDPTAPQAYSDAPPF